MSAAGVCPFYSPTAACLLISALARQAVAA